MANLFLVRAEHRQKEIVVRCAGAEPRCRDRYFLSESVLLGLAAGALGLLIADTTAQALVAFGPATLPRLHEIEVDGSVLFFTAALSLLTAIALAAPAALRYARPRLSAVLKQSATSVTAAPARQRMRRTLVVAQVALALTLVVSAALLVQSVLRLRQLQPGFAADGVLTAEIALPYTPYPSYAAANTFWQRLLEGVRALPGVEQAGAVGSLPLVPAPEYYNSALELDAPDVAAARPIATVYGVTSGYFETMQIPVLARVSNADERNGAFVSAALARRLFPDGNALGRRVRQAGSSEEWKTVIGVVGDVPRRELAGDPAELLYVLNSGTSHMTIALKARGAPADIAPALRALLRQLDPELPLANVRLMQRIVDDSLARTSFAMSAMLTAGLLALLLGAMGIYGVIAYTVGRRVHEIGLRMALGARAADIRALILQGAAGVTLSGIATGLLATLLLTRFLRHLLYDISPVDPLTLTAVAALLASTALLAAWLARAPCCTHGAPGSTATRLTGLREIPVRVSSASFATRALLRLSSTRLRR